MSKIYLKRYGEAATINFELYEVDGVDLRTDAVHAAGDTQISIDEGAQANTANGFTDEGDFYSLAFSSSEMTGARMAVRIVDQTATKVWLDDVVYIETYGHPQSAHPFLGSAVVHADNAQAGAASTITLATTASATDDFYNGNLVFLRDGTGAGQTAIITDYVGSTRVATINGSWVTNPDTTTEYELWIDKVAIVNVPTRTELNGGDYALDTDANGRMRIVDGTGAGELDTNAGAVTAGTVSDKTGYSLTVTPPTAVENRQEMDNNSTDLNTLITNINTLLTRLPAAISFSNGNVNANMEEINTIPLTGDGQPGTEFDV